MPSRRPPDDVANLDCASGTPIDPDVLAVLSRELPRLGNPHAATLLGRRAREAVDNARHHIAHLVGARADSVVITSGATEANNLGVLGTLPRHPKRVVVSATEHASVFEAALSMRQHGVEVIIVDVDRHGRVRLDALRRAVAPGADLVATMLVNNELGSINDIREISLLAAAKGAALHCDATQAVGRLPIDIDTLGVSTLALSSHKVHGPAGVGALVSSDFARLHARQLGGGQERGLRAGTVPAALAVAFGEACRIAADRRTQTAQTLVRHCRRIRRALASRPGLEVISPPEADQVGIVSVLSDVESARDLLDLLAPHVAASAGAACDGRYARPSRVLTSAGLSPSLAARVVRLSVARTTEPWEIDELLHRWSLVASLLGPLSPQHPTHPVPESS